LSQAKLCDRTARPCPASAGFTLIEVLIALAVAAVSLAAISALMAGNTRAPRRIADHLGLIATLRAVVTALPDRKDLAAGELSGEMHGQAWSVAITPFAGDFVNPRAPLWTPKTVVITAQSPSGGLLQLKTVRLGSPGGEQ
jgi:general secretion pathway protein I